MGTKKGRIYDKVAPFKGAPQRFGGKLPQTAPPLDPPLIRTVARKSSIGGLNVCEGGLNAKTLLIYSVTYFNLGGLELCLGG